METKKYKPFDKVIIKSRIDEYWSCDLYSHLDKDTGMHETINLVGLKDNEILPYEGNEHLVGTTDEPDKEIRFKKGELILVFDTISQLNDLEIKIRPFQAIYAGEDSFCTGKYFYDLCLRFADFSAYDMEETKKHILCVRNGKVVKYRENNK